MSQAYEHTHINCHTYVRDGSYARGGCPLHNLKSYNNQNVPRIIQNSGHVPTQLFLPFVDIMPVFNRPNLAGRILNSSRSWGFLSFWRPRILWLTFDFAGIRCCCCFMFLLLLLLSLSLSLSCNNPKNTTILCIRTPVPMMIQTTQLNPNLLESDWIFNWLGRFVDVYSAHQWQPKQSIPIGAQFSVPTLCVCGSFFFVSVFLPDAIMPGFHVQISWNCEHRQDAKRHHAK